MAILSNYYFSASNGTVTSSTALNNPYDSDVTVDSTAFLNVDFMHDVITDTHYDDPNRKGRHVVFLARILTDYGIDAKGIACNEYTSVCIDENGLARVYGDYPNYLETAFFLQTNCELFDYHPENCSASTPLDWNLNGTAVRVYKVNGTNNGANTFDLSDWKTGSGGTWENWYVDNGTLVETAGTQIDCSELAVNDLNWNSNISVYPNPFEDVVFIESELDVLEFELLDMNGKLLHLKENLQETTLSIDKSLLQKGIYVLKIKTVRGLSYFKILKK